MSIRLGGFLFAAAVSISAGIAAQQPPDAAPGAPLRFRAGTFTPTRGEAPPIPASLVSAGYAEGQRGYYLVQFRGPVTETMKREATAAGAELLDYIPDFAFKARMNPAQARTAERLADVAWVGIFHPGYKLGPELRRNGRHVYTVRIESGANAGAAANAIRATGATVIATAGSLFTVAADDAQLEAVARILDVASVQNFQLRRKLNEYGGGVIMGANAAHASGYTGAGQTVAIADTGLGTGVAASAHPGISASRISAIFNWPGVPDICFETIVNDGARDVDTGHGTHVAGSAVGGGGPSGEARGTAPGANLVFQAVENWAYVSIICEIFLGIPSGYYLIGIPTNISDLFQQAYSAGARIHGNSWGSDAQGAYTVDSASADDFIWTHRDMTITFAAGNSGIDFDLNGAVDPGSIGSPATAKNVISIGASENDRQGFWNCDPSLAYTTCAAQGGQNTPFTYGAAFPDYFPVPPLSTDASAGNANQLAAFSSRGPTSDGRIKPDVVAPGTWVLSAYSDLYQQGYDTSANPQNGAFQYDGWGIPQSPHYKYLGGTSMANPLGAGASAVVRHFYHASPRNHAASAALVKATLINSAIDLLDENNDGVNDNANPIPNNEEGWGRIDLANATDGTQRFVDNTGGLATGSSAMFSFTATGGAPFKATLVWSDFRSSDTALVNLVNDLDLVVTAPDGTAYRGNVFSGGWSQAGGAADRRNNVENVYIAAPAAGTWTVQVSAFSVPIGPQPFALVVDGSNTDTPPAVNLVSPGEGATVSGAVPIVIDATDAQDAPGTLTVQWNVDGGAWQPAVYNESAARYEATWDSTTVADGARTVGARATDSGGQTAGDSNAITVDNVADPPAATSLHVGDLDGTSTSSGARWRATVSIALHDNLHLPLAGATVTGTWSGGGAVNSSCTTDAAGRCSVASGQLRKNDPHVTFTVLGVAHPLAYLSAANHDSDGDSTGTVITVAKP